MKQSLVLTALCLASLIAIESCRPAVKSTSAFQNFTTQYIREEAGGVIVLKSYGAGYTQAECIQNAKYNAVRDVIFKGISGARDQRPLIMGANPEEKYRSYFTGFFAADGPYNSYVSTSNRGNIDKNDRFVVDGGGVPGRRSVTSRKVERQTIGVEVVIKKEDLRVEMEKVVSSN
jgi:hypothetical protein